MGRSKSSINKLNAKDRSVNREARLILKNDISCLESTLCKINNL